MVRKGRAYADKYGVLEIEPEKPDANQRGHRIEDHLTKKIQTDKRQIGGAEIACHQDADKNGGGGDTGDQLQDRRRLGVVEHTTARQPEAQEEHQRYGEHRGQEIVQNVGHVVLSSRLAGMRPRSV